MTVTQFHTYQEQTFDSFCTTLIRNEGINAQKEFDRRSKRETALSSVSNDEIAALSYEDKYHLESITLYLGRDEIVVDNATLGQAILTLPPKNREVILLRYFLGQNITQIATALGVTRKTVRYRINKGIELIRASMEAMGYEV